MIFMCYSAVKTFPSPQLRKRGQLLFCLIVVFMLRKILSTKCTSLRFISTRVNWSIMRKVLHHFFAGSCGFSLWTLAIKYDQPFRTTQSDIKQKGNTPNMTHCLKIYKKISSSNFHRKVCKYRWRNLWISWKIRKCGVHLEWN